MKGRRNYLQILMGKSTISTLLDMVYKENEDGGRSKGLLRKTWLRNMIEDLKEMGIRT